MRKIETIVTSVVLGALGLAMPAFAAEVHTGKAVSKITVVTENTFSTTSSTAFGNLPGASVNIAVPATKFQLVQVRFSAESFCFGAGQSGEWCSIRILADGVEMLPNVGSNYAFDTSGDSNDDWEGNAMERTMVLGPGHHTITVQFSVTDAAVSFGLDDWTMSITQYNGGL